MKKFANVFLLGLAIVVMAVSCGPNTDDKKDLKIKNPTQVRAGGEVKAEVATMDVNFGGQIISIKMDDIINISEKMSAEDQDAMDIMNVNQKLMGAEKEAQLLDVNFTMSDEPIENGMFIFGIETDDAKELILEMRDEEGFSLVANNAFKINEGQNYKALNVSSLDKGTYNFRIKDDAGRELNRAIQIVE
ncbi:MULTISPECIES: hypothetical protein [unclassified Aureispira]|uniref:hypothetical protein n=1 Tax=unclassified Aureispira TaxID=2649989 RepID=UPI000696DE48|nr:MULTISPECIES: hypothetical protein [unclassified Aureispira]WMX16767.1 hypothetical protein QP953_10340 [Aureispira sp. CCB-E]